MLPLMGVVLLPLSLLFWGKPERLLQMVIIAGIFPAAAVLNLGGICLQPTLAPGLAFISYIVLQKILGARYPAQQDVRMLCSAMVFNAVWAVFASQAMPRLFHNKVLVWPQKVDAAGTQALLAPSFGNITQDAYLIVNVILMVFAAQYVTRSQVKIRPFFNAFMLTCWLLVVICIWQFLARTIHFPPFPTSFFYSNTGWSVLDGQTAGPLPRINASFSEPSSCAAYLCGVVFTCLWLTLKGYKIKSLRALIWASTLTLCLTTSTTGFASVAIGLMLLPFLVVVTGSAKLLGRIGQLAMIGGVILGMVGMTVVTFAPSVVTAAQTVAESTADKKQSASYKERSQADADARTVFWQTYGLGAGWGSNRSSSLLPGLMASVGVIGIIALLLFDWRLVMAAGAALRVQPHSDESLVIEGFLASIFGRVVAAMLSAPTIGLPDFYVMIGIVIGAIARVRLAQRGNRHLLAAPATR